MGTYNMAAWLLYLFRCRALCIPGQTTRANRELCFRGCGLAEPLSTNSAAW
jgi:hypothetical protein